MDRDSSKTTNFRPQTNEAHGREARRRFMQDAVLAMLNRSKADSQFGTPTDAFPMDCVDKAEFLNACIEKKLYR